MRICRELGLLCNALLCDISFRSTPVLPLLDALLSSDDYKSLNFISNENIKSRKEIQSPLKAEENTELSGFLYSLGKSDARSQELLIQSFREYIQKSENAYREKYQRDFRIYIAFGFFGSAVLSLILI